MDCWCWDGGKKISTRARVKIEIENALDAGLPRAYSKDLYEAKCSAVFEHVYQSYQGGREELVFRDVCVNIFAQLRCWPLDSKRQHFPRPVNLLSSRCIFHRFAIVELLA